LDDVAIVGDVRGIGMMLGIELVGDRDEKAPIPRPEQATERVLAAARDAGLLLYSSTGHVDGINGDLIVLGPPFTLTDDDTDALVERTVAAIRSIA
jgi:adenosylmethionine-8-amino-7-oxononanoate aminotransferase